LRIGTIKKSTFLDNVRLNRITSYFFVFSNNISNEYYEEKPFLEHPNYRVEDSDMITDSQ